MSDKDQKMDYSELTVIMRTQKDSTYLVHVRSDFYPALNELIRREAQSRNQTLAENPDMYDGINDRIKNISNCAETIIYNRMNIIMKTALRDAVSDNRSPLTEMTKEEREMYESVYSAAKGLHGLIKTDKKITIPKINEIIENEKREESKPAPEKPAENETKVPEEPVISEPISDENVLIRVLEDIPTFAGPERDYTLKKEDIVTLPSGLASALINRHKAVMVNTSD